MFEFVVNLLERIPSKLTRKGRENREHNEDNSDGGRNRA